MGVERVDYSTEDEYRHALAMEEEQERRWYEEQWAEMKAQERQAEDEAEREHRASVDSAGCDKRDPVGDPAVTANIAVSGGSTAAGETYTGRAGSAS